MAVANPFKGIGEAEVSRKSTYLKDGVYLLKVKECRIKKMFGKGDSFLAEFEIVESSNPDFKPGISTAWFQKMDPPNMSLPALKGFAYACLGISTAATDKDAVEAREAVDEELSTIMVKACVDGFEQAENYFAGTLVRAELITRPNKKVPGEFTYWNFSAIVAPVEA